MIKHRLVALILGAIVVFAAGCAAPAAQSNPPAAAPTVAAPAAAAATATAPAAGDNVLSGNSGSTIQLVALAGKSSANYRVREQLAGVNFPTDAVGKTQAISGSIIGKPDGTIVSSDSKFTVDLSTLQSDQAMRDNFIKGSVLQTSQYPKAVFVPTGATGLPTTLPPTGSVSFKLTGNLTVKNVTKPVTWDVTCQPQSSTEGTCHATTNFTFDYFNLTQPHVGRVLSIDNNITLEVDVALQQGNG